MDLENTNYTKVINKKLKKCGYCGKELKLCEEMQLKVYKIQRQLKEMECETINRKVKFKNRVKEM